MKTHPYAELLPLMDGVQLQELADDIKRHGLRHKIVTHDGQIVDGRNRQAACDLAGIKPSYVEWDGKGSLAAYIASVNIPRRHLKPDQKAWLALTFIPIFAKEAAQRRNPGKSLASVEANGTQASTEARVGKAAELAADAAGVSRATVERMKRVHDKGAPEIVQAVRDGEVTARDAANVVEEPLMEQRKALAAVRAGTAKTLTKAMGASEKKANAAAARASKQPLPDGRFHVIVARQARSTSQLLALAEEIKARARANSVLLFWASCEAMADGSAARVVAAWGFAGRTVLTWVKAGADGALQPGRGALLREATEHCIVATLGEPPVYLTTETTRLMAPRQAALPEEFYELADQVFPGPKLELFGGATRKCWVAYEPAETTA